MYLPEFKSMASFKSHIVQACGLLCTLTCYVLDVVNGMNAKWIYVAWDTGFLSCIRKIYTKLSSDDLSSSNKPVPCLPT